MKKILCIIFVLLMLTGCLPTQSSSNDNETNKENYITGVWVSYSELDTMLRGDFKSEFNTAVSNCASLGITDMFVHARAFCDSIYKSQYFPLRESVKQHDFDVLAYMIDICHQNGIKFHAWLNPYRVRTADQDITALPDTSPAKQWLTDDNTDNDANVSLVGGVYLNPASSEVQALIIDGIREIIDNYAVDGIHFDDYFYPTQDETFDEQSYKDYQSQTQKSLTLDNFRRANVNALISGAYTAIKFKSKDIIFSVSPSASIEDNYNKHYADVTAWVDSGCVDYIIPQLYFGFEYPDRQYSFDVLVNKWKKELQGADTKLLIGLATYKIGTQSEPDREEWANGVEVIKKQTKICTDESAICGHIYFSYSSMNEYL